MRLVILSDMAHHHRDGVIVGHGATVREIDHLATLFDEVVHVACLYKNSAPTTALPYAASNVRLRGVPPAGGTSWKDKARILRMYPQYARVMWQELRTADAVHVRAPANQSLLALMLLTAIRWPKRRWFKYAGNWQRYSGESIAYRLQRWWLSSRLAGGAVTVNGAWPNQPSHVHTFVNPCLTDDELRAGRRIAEQKRLTTPIRMLFVGQLSRAKGVYESVGVMRRLRDLGVSSRLTFVGDGEERAALEDRVRSEKLQDVIAFAGGVPRTQLQPYLAEAHIMLLPSHSEGWPKVLSEGMAYGAVPVASAVGGIPGVLDELGFGVAAKAPYADVMAAAIVRYAKNPELWRRESEIAVAAAPRFSYAAYINAVRGIFGILKEGSSATGHLVPVPGK